MHVASKQHILAVCASLMNHHFSQVNDYKYPPHKQSGVKQSVFCGIYTFYR